MTTKNKARLEARLEVIREIRRYLEIQPSITKLDLILIGMIVEVTLALANERGNEPKET